MKAFIQKTRKGTGSGASATIGDPTVSRWATKLTIPKTVDTYLVGKSLATDIYPILYDMDPPILHINIINGIIQFVLELKKIKYNIPATKHSKYEKQRPCEVTKYFKIIPEERKATTSATAKHSEFTKILPGKDFK